MATEESFANAKTIYEEGGHSKSYASVTLATPLSSGVSKSTPISGKTEDGAMVSGKAYADYSAGDSVIRVQYQTSDIQDSHVGCQVGALSLPGVNEAITDGCLADTGTITIGGAEYDYSYDKTTDNDNGRTIQGFSIGAQKKMFDGCKGCPYDAYVDFYNYYGQFDYANQWVLAALEGRATTGFTNGGADFSKYGFTGRTGKFLEL